MSLALPRRAARSRRRRGPALLARTLLGWRGRRPGLGAHWRAWLSRAVAVWRRKLFVPAGGNELEEARNQPLSGV